MALDISDWLHEGIVLREKEFRDKAKNYDWEQYKDAYVALYCSSDAIIPAWAYANLLLSYPACEKSSYRKYGITRNEHIPRYSK